MTFIKQGCDTFISPLLRNFINQQMGVLPATTPSTVVSRGFMTAGKRSIEVSVRQSIEDSFPTHPFTNGVVESNVEGVMRRYLAMSQAFPYIQAGAYQSLIMRSIRENQSVPESVAKTFAVAMFLCGDEIGNHHILTNGGNPRLHEILRTEEQTHFSLLKKDTELLFKVPLKPEFSPATGRYLNELHEMLGSEDTSERVAAMVAFENHAHTMIEALWNSLEGIFPKIDKNALEYFSIHVGGDDPAEAYHTQTTERLIEETNSADNLEKFLEKVVANYRLNYNWCQEICQESDRLQYDSKRIIS